MFKPLTNTSSGIIISSILLIVVVAQTDFSSKVEAAATAVAAAATTNQSEAIRLKALLKPIGPCMLDAVASFLYTRSNPPTTKEALQETCKRHSEAFKCIKDRSKTMPALVRRGMLTFVSNRQREDKKFCNNINSEQSKRLIQDFKCIVEKRFSYYKTIDAEYANSLIEIERKKFTDSGLELKYFCCATWRYRRAYLEGAGKECPSAKQTMSDVIGSTVPNDINFICEEEDKLAKICPELEPIKVAKEFDPATGQSPSLTGLYLVATLGEAE